ncbi:MAG: electron transport complex subunit RsxE [Pseudomonadota bacterium]
MNTVWRDGLWHNNPGIVQLLGLCPLLAVTNTAVNALGLAVATLFVLTASNTIVSITRRALQPEIRIPAYVLVIAALVTATELAFHAYAPTLHARLGIFLPLIVTNCAIVARAEAFASRQPVGRAFADGLAHGLGFGWVLVIVGALRELVGHGTLFRDLGTLIPGAGNGGITVVDGGLLLALLPPGAFFALAAVLVARNIIASRQGQDNPELAREQG